MSTPYHLGNKQGGLNGYQSDFYGNDFTWFIGFVEKTYDAEDDVEKLNRVAVRIWGLHDFNATLEELPLAQVLMPTTVGGVHDQSGVFGLEVGAQVFGFWLDRHKQHPVIVGSLVGFTPETVREKEDYKGLISFPNQTTEGDSNVVAQEQAEASFN